MNDAISEPAFVEELEFCSDVVRQGMLAAAHHDGAQEQVALVDKPRSDCLAGKLGASICDVCSRGRLELTHGGGIELSLDECPRTGA